MSDFVSNLKSLKEEHDRYEDAYLNAFYHIAQKDVVLEKDVQYFDTNVVKRLTDAFCPNDQFSLLGVGVGEGLHEFQFLKSLQSYYPSLCNVAVDPNQAMLDTFKNKVATLNSNDKSSVVCHWFAGPLSEFVADSPLARSKYNLISTIHSLYYTGDFETTFTQMVRMLKDSGIIVIVCHTDDNILRKTFMSKSWLPATTSVNDQLSSRIIREFADSQGYDVITVPIPLEWDITDVFDEKSDFGNKLLDFFAQTAYFRQTAPKELLDDLMAFWRSLSTENEDGRVLAPGASEILLISK